MHEVTSSRIAHTPPRVLPRLRPQTLIAAVFLALPAILFYGILFRTAIDVPFEDDYEALLDFLNRMAELKSVSARASYFLAAQYNEYKLFFGHGVAWLQFALLGHVDVRLLCAFGNIFVLLLAILLWKMFLPNHKVLCDRVVLFIPVSWLLFQLQYAETLNWSMPALQNLPVLVFSFGSIYCLLRPTRRAFCAALVCLVLAVAASGNGLLLIPMGLLILAVNRYYVRIVSWLSISAGCVAAYAYHYNVMSSQSQIHHSVLWTVMRPRPFYVIAFIGNAAAFVKGALWFGGRYHPLDLWLSLLLGLVLCVFFVAVAKRGYIRRNPLVSYCVLYLFLTALGVAGLRSDFGIAQSLAPRYRVYSALFLIFAWFVIVEEYLQQEIVSLRRSRILLITIVGTVLFSLSMDAVGWFYLVQRNREIVRGMAAFEHPVSPVSSIGPILPDPSRNARFDVLVRRAPGILRQSIKLGIYRPPMY